MLCVWPFALSVVLEITMAMVGNAGSTTAIIFAFSLESILSRFCLVDRRGLFVRGVYASDHAALCPWRAIFRARMRAGGRDQQRHRPRLRGTDSGIGHSELGCDHAWSIACRRNVRTKCRTLGTSDDGAHNAESSGHTRRAGMIGIDGSTGCKFVYLFVCLITELRLSCGGRPPTREGPYATRRQAEAVPVRIRRPTPPQRAPGEFGVSAIRDSSVV